MQEILLRSFGPDLSEKFGINDYTWLEGLIGDNGVLNIAILDYENTVKEFVDLHTKIIDELKIDENLSNTKLSRDLNNIKYRLKVYKEKRLIDFFTRSNVLPKYGFPVDTVELHIPNSNNRNRLTLGRDLKLAISEYSPGEKVVADNNLYTSRYIKQSIIGGKYAFHESFIKQCDNNECRAWNYSESGNVEKKHCISCGQNLSDIAKWSPSIEPVAGFISDGTKENVPMRKPEKIYRNDDAYIGNNISVQESLYKSRDSEVVLKSTENDKIMVTSKSAFYVCPDCGFALGDLDIVKNKKGKKDKKIEKLRAFSNSITPDVGHKKSNGYDCSCKVLNRKRLNHVFSTDVVIMEFNDSTSDLNQMLSVMYAIADALSFELDIERRDIDVCLRYNNKFGYDIVLYDAVAGGAGHVRRLLDNTGKNLTQIFKSAIYKLDNCSSKCHSSCYNCLRSYYNQKNHDLIDRNLALEFLKKYNKDFIYIKDNSIDVKLDNTNNTDIEVIDKKIDISNNNIIESLRYVIDIDDNSIDSQIINKIVAYIDVSIYSGASYYGSEILFSKNKKASIDLMWEKSKVILLLSDKKELYENIKNSEKYKIFYIDENFDINQFLNEIKR